MGDRSLSANPLSQGQGDVRKCAKCGQTSVVLVFEWNRDRGMGLSIRDYRCQACGAKFTIHPKAETLGIAIAGFLLLPTCLPGAIALFIAWNRSQQDARNPVVPFAPRPTMQYRDGPPRRQCGACSKEAVLTGVTKSSSRGIPTGTTYDYQCSGCNRAFTIESIWGHCFTLFAASVLAAITVAVFAMAESPWWRFGGGGLLALASLFVVGQTVLRASNRFRYPVID